MSTPIDEATALRVATVDSVAPDGIKAALDEDAPQATALNAGQPARFPRINGFVLVPNETGAVIGLVSWLGIERSGAGPGRGGRDAVVELPRPSRRVHLTPVGTLVGSRRDGDIVYEVRRGVATYPSVGDPVLLPTPAQLRALVEAQGDDRRVWIGTSPLGANARVSVDPDKLFGRHLAILGNTGSGKSCSVAGLIRWSLEAAEEARAANSRSGKVNARFLVLDPNGEYRETFSDRDGVRVFQAPPPQGGASPLAVPAWIWNSHEWSAFAQAAPGAQRPVLLQGLRNLRAGELLTESAEARLARLLRGYASLLGNQVSQGPQGYTGFGPAKRCAGFLIGMADGAAGYVEDVPQLEDALGGVISGARDLCSGKAYEWKGTTGYNDFTEPELEGILSQLRDLIEALPKPPGAGGASEDAPVVFDPEELAEHLELLVGMEDLSQAAQFVATLTMRIRSMLADRRLGPIVKPEDDVSFQQWLEDYVGADGAENGEIAILDLSLVPADVLHVVIAVVARVVFEAVQRYRRSEDRELPTVLVLEEAHTFIERRLPDDRGAPTPSAMCRETFERIAREGRKFGLGLVLSSQRPSELSPTVLAQCNTFLLHRLVNDRDQDLVGRLVPDNLGGLLRDLPSLPSQQAVLLGWATPAPVLVQMRHLPLEHRPSAADPAFWDAWTGEVERPVDWGPIVAEWTSSASEESNEESE